VKEVIMTIEIDAHHHFWQLAQPFDYRWLDAPALAPIRRDFLPADLAERLALTPIRKTILVQTQHDLRENAWALGLATKHEFIAGVVGWIRPIEHAQRVLAPLGSAVGAAGPVEGTSSTARLVPAMDLAMKLPIKVSTATRLANLTYMDLLNRGLAIMDSTAVTLCMDNRMPIIVFDLFTEGNIERVILGERIGTRVDAEGGIA